MGGTPGTLWVSSCTSVKSPALRTAANSARVLGVHLEGPFINPGRLGAQPNAVRSGSIEELSSLHALARIRVLTLAPEISGHLDFIRELKIAGIIPQIGHSNGSYEEGVAALDAGVGGFTPRATSMSASPSAAANLCSPRTAMTARAAETEDSAATPLSGSP